MAILGQQIINIGLPNESANSDSLYVAFNKVQNNFDTLFSCSSPYTTFSGNSGISVSANSNTGTIDIQNTGVTSINAGEGIILSSSNGNITISSNAGGNGGGGTVTSVGITPVSNTRLVATNSPIISSGNISLDLATTGVLAGTYTYPTLSVDAYGRVTGAVSGNSVGTVTSVGIAPGFGIQVSNSPITTSGTITVTNTGVTRLSAGTGIQLSGSNGNVTVSTTLTGGTVTSVGVISNSLVVANSPVVSTGQISIELPNPFSSLTVTGNVDITSGDLNITSGDIYYNCNYASYYSTNLQPNYDPSVALPVEFNVLRGKHGISLQVESPSKFVFTKAGLYNIQVEMQVTKSDAGTDYFETWLAVNGNAVSWTNKRVPLSAADTITTVTSSYIVSVTDSDYVEVMWGSSDVDMYLITLDSIDTTMGIAVPSAVINITPVGA